MKVDSPSGGIDCRSGGLNIQVEGKAEDEDEDAEITQDLPIEKPNFPRLQEAAAAPAYKPFFNITNI